MKRQLLAAAIAATALTGLAIGTASPAHSWCDEVDHVTCGTTTTTQPSTTTSSTTTSTAPSSTTTSSSTLPPPVVQCLGQPAHDRTIGAEPCTPPKVAAPRFTG